MVNIKISQIQSLKGEIEVPPDKSISHRALIISSYAEGKTIVKNLLRAEDTLSTKKCLEELGVVIIDNGPELTIDGSGGLHRTDKILDVGNSGTSIRLLLGMLASHNYKTVISGDSSIQKRPMGRVIIPLTMMGAQFKVNNKNLRLEDLLKSKDVFFPQIEIIGGDLNGINYEMPVASAQVKSAILIAGLKAKGETKIIEPGYSRDHTERMLEYFGAKINIDGNKISISSESKLFARELYVPGDISSAAFFMAAALLIKNSEILIKNVGLNPKRTGIIDVMRKMGAKIEIKNKTIIGSEEVGDIFIVQSKLNGIKIEGEIIPKLIDEIPVISLLAALSEGKTEISDAKELRFKESDRLKVITQELSKFGVHIKEKEDGLIIFGNDKLNSAKVNSYKDHRIAMTFIIAGLLAKGETEVEDIDCINTSFPNFINLLNAIKNK